MCATTTLPRSSRNGFDFIARENIFVPRFFTPNIASITGVTFAKTQLSG